MIQTQKQCICFARVWQWYTKTQFYLHIFIPRLGNAQNVNSVELDLNRITHFLGHRSWYAGQALCIQISLFRKLNQTFVAFNTFSNSCTVIYQLYIYLPIYTNYIIPVIYVKHMGAGYVNFWVGANRSFVSLLWEHNLRLNRASKEVKSLLTRWWKPGKTTIYAHYLDHLKHSQENVVPVLFDFFSL